MGIVPMCGMIASCQASINIHERNKREEQKRKEEQRKKEKQEGGK